MHKSRYEESETKGFLLFRNLLIFFSLLLGLPCYHLPHQSCFPSYHSCERLHSLFFVPFFGVEPALQAEFVGELLLHSELEHHHQGEQLPAQ